MSVTDVLRSFFDPEVLARFWPYLLAGLGQTALLSCIAIPLGLAGGLGLALLGSDLGRRGRAAVTAYVDLLRSFPPLVLLILVSAGLPHFGLRLPPLVAVVGTLLLNSSAYYAEILRAGLRSVPRGLPEAARATGLGYACTAWHVRLPVAVRNVLPDLLSNTLELVKLTSIASVVTFVELTQAARVVQGLTFSPAPIMAAALLYLVLLWPLARLVSRLERRSLG